MITVVLVGCALTLVASLAVGVVLVFVLRPPGHPVGESLLVLPQALRLTAALYLDRSLPSSVRWRLRIAVIYNLQPINVIPDFVPIVGFADNVAVLAWALRATIRISGGEAIARHWRGSSESLTILYRALRLQYPA